MLTILCKYYHKQISFLFRPVSLYEVLKRHKLGAVGPAVMAGLCWVGWVALIIVEIVNINVPDMHLDGIYSLGWVFFLGFVTIITATRANIRSHYGINGNPIEDFFAALLVYPCVMVQLETVSEVNGIAPMMPDNRDAHLSTVNVINNKNHD